MLCKSNFKAFIPTVNQQRAKDFYKEILGLPIIAEDDFALEFDSNGTRLRITTVNHFAAQPFTVAGWNVENIVSMIKYLSDKGVKFEKYNFLEQDMNGIWTSPGGFKVAWFKDPDGNLLSLSE